MEAKLLTGGLLISFKNGCDFELENINLEEKFESQKLLKKYGFDLGWYTLWDKFYVITKCVEGGETQIFLADNQIDGESILGVVVNEVINDFSVDYNDQKEIFKILKEHKCCYF